MENVLKPRALLIESIDLKHMVESKESFSFLDSDSSILIQMGDYFQIVLNGKGTVNLEHGSFYDVFYVPSLASNLLSVYQMTQT